MDLVTLPVCYLNRAAALQASSAQRDRLTMFVPTKERVPEGTTVRIHITFGDSHRSFDLVGKVLSLATASAAGAYVVFEGEYKRGAAGMLAFCAGKPPAMGTAESRRFPLRFQCQAKLQGRTLTAQLLDLSRTGAFVTTDEANQLSKVDRLDIQVRRGVFGLFGRWVRGEVIWRGRKAGRYGVGVRFVNATEDLASVIHRHAGEAAVQEERRKLKEKERKKKPSF